MIFHEIIKFLITFRHNLEPKCNYVFTHNIQYLACRIYLEVVFSLGFIFYDKTIPIILLVTGAAVSQFAGVALRCQFQ